jgi:Ca-activated chloride channel family protein
MGFSAIAASGLIALVFVPGLLTAPEKVSFSNKQTRDEPVVAELSVESRGDEKGNLNFKEERSAAETDFARQLESQSAWESQNRGLVYSDLPLDAPANEGVSRQYAKDTKSEATSLSDLSVVDSLQKKSELSKESLAESASENWELARETKLGAPQLNRSQASAADEYEAGGVLSRSQNVPLQPSSAPANGPVTNRWVDSSEVGEDAAKKPASGSAGYSAGLSAGSSYGSGYGGAGGAYGGARGAGGPNPANNLYGSNLDGAAPAPAQQPATPFYSYSDVEVDLQASKETEERYDSLYRYRAPTELKQQVAEHGGVYTESIPADLGGKELKKYDRESSSGDRFEVVKENEFQAVAQQPVTTFSVDVDTASYSKIRQIITESQTLPDPNAVRIEEMVNYFNYTYAGPTDSQPFAAHFAASQCPWASEHKLLRIALQAKKIEPKSRPLSNIVFLIDVSGSMDEPNKLPLVKKAAHMLVRQLGEKDRVAIVVYASRPGCVLPSTNAIKQDTIMRAIDQLVAEGSTNGGGGIQLAYQIARENFIKNGVNRIILCTDGDFNVGTTSDEELVNLVVQNAKTENIFLTCLGFGQGNMNDSMMEKITNRGNGYYAMVDSELEARKIMVEQINATLVTVAKDVKIQIEFNPQKVSHYRQIGYEDRKLANRDFNDDTKDAGEIGAGHRVTALYEIVPSGVIPPQSQPQDEPLRYSVAQAETRNEPAKDQFFGQIPELDKAISSELLTVKVRYKMPEENVSTKVEFPLSEDADTQPADQDFHWASSIAQFGMLLRHSPYAANLKWSGVLEQAAAAAGSDETRLEAVELMRRAKNLSEAGAQR